MIIELEDTWEGLGITRGFDFDQMFLLERSALAETYGSGLGPLGATSGLQESSVLVAVSHERQ